MIYFAARGYSRLIPSGFFILKAINVAGKEPFKSVDYLDSPT